MINDVELLRLKFMVVRRPPNERKRRIMAAREALLLGYGGISKISRACGLSRKAIAKGMHDPSIRQNKIRTIQTHDQFDECDTIGTVNVAT